MKALKLYGFYLHESFGPLYIIEKFRDGSGTVYCGINGKDGVSYQDNAIGFVREITHEEFDLMTAGPDAVQG